MQMTSEAGKADGISYRLYQIWLKYRAELLTCFAVSFAAYMFVFTNKIPNWDDTQYLFLKGASLSSGRWGLDILSMILPNYSIPWLWGWTSVILLAVSVCVVLDTFQIRNKLLRCALAGAIIVFPSEIGTMLYMFTSTSYAIAFFCTVTAVRLFVRDGAMGKVVAVILTVFSVSIYQAYVAITASFFVLLMIQMIMKGKEIREVIMKGLKFLAFLVASLAIYCAITYLALMLCGDELNGWAVQATTTSGGILYRAVRSWKLFVAMIVYRDYGLVTSTYSWVAHLVCLGCTGITAFAMILKSRKPAAIALFALLGGVLFPLSINAIVLLIGENGVHALTLYSFISVYLFMAVVAERVHLNGAIRRVVACGLAVIVMSNIYAANKAYFKQYMVYENTVSFYQSVITQVQMTPGFDEDSVVAIIGNIKQDSAYLENFGDIPIYGLNGFKGHVISDEFIQHYLGVDFTYASGDEIEQIRESLAFQEMPSYPYYGYVQEIGNYIVVKLGE